MLTLKLALVQSVADGGSGRGMTDLSPVAVGVYLLVQGVEADAGVRPMLAAVRTEAAEDPPEGAAHVLVPVRVDDGVHQGVALGQDQEVLLKLQNIDAVAHAVQQQQDQAWCPADNKTSWENEGEKEILN